MLPHAMIEDLQPEKQLPRAPATSGGQKVIVYCFKGSCPNELEIKGYIYERWTKEGKRKGSKVGIDSCAERSPVP